MPRRLASDVALDTASVGSADHSLEYSHRHLAICRHTWALGREWLDVALGLMPERRISHTVSIDAAVHPNET